MKKIFILMLFFPLLACNSIIKNKQSFKEFNCPSVFFSPKDKTYIDKSTSIDDILFKGQLNNFAVNNLCQQKENIAIIPLDILIIAEPMNSFENSQLNFPVFISLLDNNDKILETQYFLVSGVMKKNPETNIFVESDITYKLKIVTEYLNTSQIIVGFMLDDKKKFLLD